MFFGAGLFCFIIRMAAEFQPGAIPAKPAVHIMNSQKRIARLTGREGVRMHKLGTVSLCTVALIIFFFVMVAPGYAQEELAQEEPAKEELCIPMGVLTLDPLEGVDQRRASVAFNHSLHFDYACQKCHHDWAGEAEMKKCSATECHDQLSTPDLSEAGHPYTEAAIQYYKKAYHQLCIGCHKEIKEKNLALELSREPLDQPIVMGGPTGCINCHPKDESEMPEERTQVPDPVL